MQKQTITTQGTKTKGVTIPEWLLSLYEKSGITMVKMPTQIR